MAVKKVKIQHPNGFTSEVLPSAVRGWEVAGWTVVEEAPQQFPEQLLLELTESEEVTDTEEA